MTKSIASGHLGNSWIQVDQAPDPRFFIKFLDASRVQALEFARSNPKLAFAHLELEPGKSVLDCGCGTGDMLTLISQLTAPGDACGGDLSNEMLLEARRRADALGAERIRFEPMDVHSLGYPDASYDRVLATQLLVHVPDARLAMHELCRVTAPGGLVAIADADWDTLVVGSTDKEAGRRFTRLFSDGMRNGTMVRNYAGWLRAEGFVDIKTIPKPIVFDEWTFVRDWILESSLPHFVAEGSMSSQEAQALVDDLDLQNANGNLFGALSFYTVTGRRP